MATKKKSRKKSSSGSKKISKTSPKAVKIEASITDVEIDSIDAGANSVQDNENAEVQPGAGEEDESSKKNVWITDVTGQQPAKKKPEPKKVRIELENKIEYKGIFYRGVQLVDKKLAEKLQELENQTKTT